MVREGREFLHVPSQEHQALARHFHPLLPSAEQAADMLLLGADFGQDFAIEFIFEYFFAIAERVGDDGALADGEQPCGSAWHGPDFRIAPSRLDQCAEARLDLIRESDAVLDARNAALEYALRVRLFMALDLRLEFRCQLPARELPPGNAALCGYFRIGELICGY